MRIVSAIALPPIHALPRWPARDRDGFVRDATRAVAVAMDERMREEARVVALREVRALVCTARLTTVQRRIHDRLCDVEHEGELEGRDALGVESETAIVERDVGEAFLQLAERGGTTREL